MEVVLAGLARSVCVVYLDDVLVFWKTVAEHNSNLKSVRVHLALRKFAVTPLHYGQNRIFKAQRARRRE